MMRTLKLIVLGVFAAFCLLLALFFLNLAIAARDSVFLLGLIFIIPFLVCFVGFLSVYRHPAR